MDISDSVRQRVSNDSQDRCGYCLMPVDLIYGFIEIDHINPRARGGADSEVNLWLACSRCNRFKSDQTHALDPETQVSVELFNPRQQVWGEHFDWKIDDQAIIIGLTPSGRATVTALQINLEDSVRFRRLMTLLGLYPPD